MRRRFRMYFGTCSTYVLTCTAHVWNLRHLRLDLDGSVSARGEEQKGLKMRIQKCSSTWRRAKSRQNAHPEMRQHVEKSKIAVKCTSRNATARGEEQNRGKMRIQKCYSTWRRAKSRQNAHPEMLQHVERSKKATKCASRNAPACGEEQNRGNSVQVAG